MTVETILRAVSPCPVTLPRRDLLAMGRIMRGLTALSRLGAYRQWLAPQLPPVARFDPGHDAVFMGFDFHLTPAGPRLIEVNTNAGGGLLAYMAQTPGYTPLRPDPNARHQRQLLHFFAVELGRQRGTAPLPPHRVAIMDANPEGEFLYPEMLALQRLFQANGSHAVVVSPEQLEADESGVRHRGEPVDLVYNRHCDFYLEQPQLAGLRAAYLARRVCLSPNPFSYGLLADKRRLLLFSDPAFLNAMDPALGWLAEAIPESRPFTHWPREMLWRERQQWVFKPPSLYGGKGVLLGRKITRTRFDQLEPAETLVQALAPPSTIHCAELGEMKCDFRLFTYRERIMGVAARVYRGQVTNFRSPGNGYAPVHIVARGADAQSQAGTPDGDGVAGGGTGAGE